MGRHILQKPTHLPLRFHRKAKRNLTYIMRQNWAIFGTLLFMSHFLYKANENWSKSFVWILSPEHSVICHDFWFMLQIHYMILDNSKLFNLSEVISHCIQSCNARLHVLHFLVITFGTTHFDFHNKLLNINLLFGISCDSKITDCS